MVKHKDRKTLYSKLTNRYQLIIRNDENFAEKTTVSFTYSKVIAIAFILFAIVFTGGVLSYVYIFSKWDDEEIAKRMESKQVSEFAYAVDTMLHDFELIEKKSKSINIALNGGEGFPEDIDSLVDAESVITNDMLGEIAPIDSQVRAEYQQAQLSDLEIESGDEADLSEMYFYTPVEAFNITQHFDGNKHFGIDVVAKEGDYVKSIADGIVLFSSWTREGGYELHIQHKNGLISKYKHNSELLKKVGNFVSAGDFISVIGNTGEITNGVHLHFEMWYKMKPINPERYIEF